jgi:hypothetical protein
MRRASARGRVFRARDATTGKDHNRRLDRAQDRAGRAEASEWGDDG